MKEFENGEEVQTRRYAAGIVSDSRSRHRSTILRQRKMPTALLKIHFHLAR
jgi:hypothetical protein